MYKNLDPRNTAYKLADKTPRIDRPFEYQRAQAILAGARMGDGKVWDMTSKRLNEKKERLKKNESFREKHLQMVKEITNKKFKELEVAEKTAQAKLKKNKKAIEDNVQKKTKAFSVATKAATNAKEILNKAIAARANKMAKANQEYTTLKNRINANKIIYNNNMMV